MKTWVSCWHLLQAQVLLSNFTDKQLRYQHKKVEHKLTHEGNIYTGWSDTGGKKSFW